MSFFLAFWVAVGAQLVADLVALLAGFWLNRAEGCFDERTESYSVRLSATSVVLVSVLLMPRSSRARDRRRRHQRLMRKLENEDARDVIDAVGHGIGLVNGEVRAVFRDGHLRKFVVFETRRLTPEYLDELDKELGVGRYYRPDTL